jgi:hypothetical protein
MSESHTTAWNVQVYLSFFIALFALAGGILFLPVDWWSRGYLMMGTMFTVGSTFTLAKTVRDNHESAKLRNRVNQAKAEELLHRFEEAA